MDTLTHALSGALLARATAPRDAPPGSLRRRVAAGFFAGAAPDLDFVLSYAGPVVYLEQHRGVTHSVLLLPLWALLLAWLLAKILREPRGWRALYGVTALSLAAHIAGDLITSFGTVVFAPISDWRAAIGATFIIDLWFSGIILAGLLLSLIFRKTRLPAVAASAVLAGYVGFQYVQRQNAVEFGEAYAASLGLKGAVVSAHPRPVSPFNWTVFVSDEATHRFAHVNLVRREPRRTQPGDGFIARINSPYLPLDQAAWVTQTRYGHPPVDELGRQAWSSPALGFFRWFADVPAFDGMSEGSTCVWFKDLRFLTPGRDGMPFRFGACREGPGGAWRAYQRGDSGTRIPLP
ncbi:MAG TPA: metal-dependent hydrolase [Burkholderiales bacterium]|nr:metal-dependent hydrolase [Burkholderiales bacterium]